MDKFKKQQLLEKNINKKIGKELKNNNKETKTFKIRKKKEKTLLTASNLNLYF